MEFDEWSNAIIAQSDDCDYSESGWVAWVINDRAYLGNYSHCSCYCTWDALMGNDGNIRFEWSGTISELLELAQTKNDPNMPGRISDPKDCDYIHLMSVYNQIIEWNKKVN